MYWKGSAEKLYLMMYIALLNLQKGVMWEIKNGISFVEEEESIGIA